MSSILSRSVLILSIISFVIICLFLQDFEHSIVRVWMEENWRSVCAWASGIYMLLIFGGQSYMANRCTSRLCTQTRPGVNHTIFQTCIQPAGTSDSVEYVPGSVQYYGGSQDYTRVHSYSLHTGILPLTLHTQVSQY